MISTIDGRGGFIGSAEIKPFDPSAYLVAVQGPTKPSGGTNGPPAWAGIQPCGTAALVTFACSTKPTDPRHSNRVVPFGCGKGTCSESICGSKFAGRRYGKVWSDRFSHLDGSLSHVVLTVPPALRAFIKDLPAFNRLAVAAFEAWRREWGDVDRTDKFFLLEVTHPTGDDLYDWSPHANIFVTSRVLTADGRQKTIRVYATPAELARLRVLWLAELLKLIPSNVTIPDDLPYVHVVVHSHWKDKREALRRELRSFPGWDGRLYRTNWWGAFGAQVWSKTREQLGIAPRKPGPLTCTEESEGSTCGARLVPVLSLSPEQQAEFLTDPLLQLRPHEREAITHARHGLAGNADHLHTCRPCNTAAMIGQSWAEREKWCQRRAEEEALPPEEREWRREAQRKDRLLRKAAGRASLVGESTPWWAQGLPVEQRATEWRRRSASLERAAEQRGHPVPGPWQTQPMHFAGIVINEAGGPSA